MSIPVDIRDMVRFEQLLLGQETVEVLPVYAFDNIYTFKLLWY
jgi:hypothetical protein